MRERLVALPPTREPAAQTRAVRAARGHGMALLGRDGAADTLFAHLAAEAPGEPTYAAERGLLAARRGAAAEVARIDVRLATATRPYDWGRTPYARAVLAAARGDRDGALALLREALAHGAPYGPALHADPALAARRDDLRFRELFRPKG